jgi:type II secretory pathway component PulK
MKDSSLTITRERGVILILTLWMVTVLSLLAYSLAYEMRIEARLTKLKKDNLVAFQLAKAGVAKAICDLKNDMVIDRTGKSQIFDAEGDVWKNPEDKINVSLGEGTYSVRIIDEESFININIAHPILMTEAIKYFKGDDEDEKAQAERTAIAIYDWRDPDDSPANGSVGTEKEYYSELIAKDQGIEYTKDFDSGYRPKNDFFSSVEELLSVYGVTPDLFYGFNQEERKGEIYRERSRRGQRRNPHIMGGRSETESEWEVKPPEGLRDICTVNSTGEININTAGEAVLTAVIAAARISDPDPSELARAIIKYRRDGRDSKLDNEKAFHNVGDLSQVEGLSGPLIQRMQSIQRLTTVSKNFRIISEGQAGRAHRTIETVAARTWEAFNVDAKDKDFDESVKRRVKRVDKDKEDSPLLVESPTIRIVHWRER